MEASQIRSLRPKLRRYLKEFRDCFSRSEPAENLFVYISGQLSDLERKSIEPIADRAGVPPRTLQQFLSLAAWDEGLMNERLAQIVARDHGHPLTIGVIDETSFAKQGTKTPGVQPQYCGARGKVDNCVVSVHLSYVAGTFHTLLRAELFLPEGWSADRQRCQEAGIPEGMVYRPKWKMALEQRRWAVAQGVRLDWMTVDAGYGEVPEFLFGLDDDGQRYVAEVPSIFYAWLQRPEVLQKQHHPGPPRKGRPRRYPRLKAKSLPTITVRNMLRYNPDFRRQPWQKFHIKDTTKGPEVWEVKTAVIYLKRDGLPTWPHRLIVARNLLNPKEVKYFISNAPEDTSLELLLHVAFSRYHVERCFEETKGELGMDHFEVRNYQSLTRHLLVSAVSHLFLAKVQQEWGGKTSGTDPLPSPPGGRGPGPLLVVDRPGAHGHLGEGSRAHHPDPGAQRQSPAQPHQATQAAAA